MNKEYFTTVNTTLFRLNKVVLTVAECRIFIMEKISVCVLTT